MGATLTETWVRLVVALWARACRGQARVATPREAALDRATHLDDRDKANVSIIVRIAPIFREIARTNQIHKG
jgi:hypothetical protein